MKYKLLKRFLIIRNFIRQKIDRKVIIFLFFLCISTFFWLLNALSKEYITNIHYPVRYSNFPKNKVLVGDLPVKLDIRVKAFGFTLLKYKIKPSLAPINLDLRSTTFYQSSNLHKTANYYILTRYERDKIDKQLSSEIQVIEISPDTIHFQFVNVIQKKIPVKANLNVAYEKQFMQNGKIIIEPDSIIIKGPQTILDTINYFKTKNEKFVNVSDTITENVELLTIKNVKTSKSKVKIIWPVEKFTETTIFIPIEISNLPDTLNMTIFPKKLKVSFLVALSNYEKVKEFMFKAFVDYSKINESLNDKLKIELIKYPDFISSIKQYPLNVEYIIEK
ncbi:MAG: hypothetical protein GXO79_07125 [Chlorobi bacterium]|nr:hypothetical protein [Chlorobiota bacterium]